MPFLQNWSLRYIGEFNDNLYLAPELRTLSLHGEVYNDEKGRFKDGEVVTTSHIMNIDGRVVTTRNTVYTLGDVDPNYVAWHKENYPDSKFDLTSDTPLEAKVEVPQCL